MVISLISTTFMIKVKTFFDNDVDNSSHLKRVTKLIVVGSRNMRLT